MAVAILFSAAQRLLGKLPTAPQPLAGQDQAEPGRAAQTPTRPQPSSPDPSPRPPTAPDGDGPDDQSAPATHRSRLDWTPALRIWARAATAAMRPEDWKGLLLNSWSFISDSLRGQAASAPDDALDTEPTFSQTPLTVERIKPPSPGADAAYPVPNDYQLIWRVGPKDYITPDGFTAVFSLLTAWKDDIELGSITRCASPTPLVRRIGDDGSHSETRLSAVIHNFMLERYGRNTEGAWQNAVEEFSKAIEATESWLAVFYSADNFDLMKQHGGVSYGDMSVPDLQFWDESCNVCNIGDFLAFAIEQTDQWGHPGMRLCQVAMMKALVDLEAYHRQTPIISFVRVEKEMHHPGYFFEDDRDILERTTVKTLRAAWTYRRYAQTQRRCHLYDQDAQSSLSQDGTRRDKIVSAAAASIKAARRSGDGRQLYIAPSISLLREKYRRSSETSLLDGYARFPPARDQHAHQQSAKRKARVATPDPRLLKRSRFDKERASEALRARFAAAKETKEAAGIPLPPSPAATDIASDASEEDVAGARDTSQQRRRLLAWDVVFAEDDPFAPHLKISSSKAEELRLIAEQKRAALEAARLKKEAEIRRKEEERRRKEEEELLKSSGLRPPTRHVIERLSETWHTRVYNAVRADPSKNVAKSPEGTILRSKDFLTVVPKSEWLNDEIVNGYLLHLANYINGKAGITNTKTQTPKCYAFTSFFWKPLSTKGAAGTERWMKRVGITRDNFLNVETILIPICESHHWTLVVVRPGRCTVTHMDSLGSGGAGRRTVTDIVMRWVKDLLKDKYADKRWRVQHYQSPRQTNGWDCGVHTVTNALFVSLGLDPAFYETGEMPLQRDRIAATLINGGFSGDFDLAGV